MFKTKKKKIPSEIYKTTHYPPIKHNGKTNEYYNVQGLVDSNAHIHISVGGRGSGKTTDACTTLMLYDAVKNNNKFVFVRNLQTEIANHRLYSYFNSTRFDAYPELAEYDHIYISVKKEIFLRKVDDDGDVIEELQVGVAYSIENALINKSMSLPRNIYNKMVIEEFANNYVKWPDYFDRYTALVSTFQRWHDDFKVYMFANKVNRNNVFFIKYDVPDINKHKLDEIHIHRMYSSPPVYDDQGNQLFTKIAVENVKNLTEPSVLLMGEHIQNNTSGDEFETQKHDLIDVRARRKEQYKFYFASEELRFKICLMKNTKREYWFEIYHVKKIPPNARVITPHFSTNRLHTKRFIPLSKKEDKIFNLLRTQNKVLFISDLCGTEFNREFQKVL